MYSENKLWIGTGIEPVFLIPKMANRHGLIAGATGTGKTVTLKVMAEAFSDMGVPVFLADIKGDLSGLAVQGSPSAAMESRAVQLGASEFTYRSFPVQLWDLFGENGHPIRTTVSEMGAVLLSRILNLNDTQSGVLNVIFRIADDKGLLLLDLKDLKSMLQYVGEHGKEFTLTYGNISKQSIGAILRNLLILEDQGGDYFFGEPDLDILDWFQTDREERGFINILHSVRLYQYPSLYATFLLWMLSELFEILPEAGDLEKPKLVFFFDEAHLLFKDVPKVLLDKIEQVVRLIRSKGVGIYFVTQSPSDLPQNVQGQLGNRIQHALRAYTPGERKKAEAAAESFRPNPAFDTVTAITELATGEALISCLDAEGRPGIVERVLVLPPQSSLSPLSDNERKAIIAQSSLRGKYDARLDRFSAFETLKNDDQSGSANSKKTNQEGNWKNQMSEEGRRGDTDEEDTPLAGYGKKSSGRGYQRQTPLEKTASAVLTTIGREVSRSLIRGILGSLKK
ncbi:MAG: putative ATPase [Bacillota bacterium]|nr:putative ATPase [Bacillota bacterium]